VRSRAGLRAVSWSLFVLLLTTVIQVVVFLATDSVALLADLIHNGGDALTAIPVGAAFLLRSRAAERRAGYFVVATIFVSAAVAAVAAVERLVSPQSIDHLAALALAGATGFVGNEIAARIRLRAGRRLSSPALIADGNHARVDGFVSLAVVASAAVVALGLPIADPLIGPDHHRGHPADHRAVVENGAGRSHHRQVGCLSRRPVSRVERDAFTPSCRSSLGAG
jgi:cation diffusion facilitator family transporter